MPDTGTPVALRMDADTFMVLVFANAPKGTKYLSFKALRKIYDRFVEAMVARHINILIAWTRNNVIHTIELFPDIFKLCDVGVAWCAKNNAVTRELYAIDFTEEVNDLLDKTIAPIVKQVTDP